MSGAARARKLTASGRDRGRPLADFLAERLGLDRAAAAALVRAGGVYVARERVEDAERPLDAGQRVTVRGMGAGVEAAGPAGSGVAAGSAVAAGSPPALSIVHEDGDVLVVDKPAGVPSQATRDTAIGALDRMVAAVDAGARLLHRLDRDASGLVLFTRTAAARRRFAGWLRGGQLERRYVAAAWGHIAADAGRLERAIGPDPRDRRRMSAGHGRAARTVYRVDRRGRAPDGAPTTLVELDLETGRTHQIRVHLSDAGHPVCGDRLYGPAAPVAVVAPGVQAAPVAVAAVDRLCLHGHRLAWPGAPAITSPVPPLFDELVR